MFFMPLNFIPYFQYSCFRKFLEPSRSCTFKGESHYLDPDVRVAIMERLLY